MNTAKLVNSAPHWWRFNISRKSLTLLLVVKTMVIRGYVLDANAVSSLKTKLQEMVIVEVVTNMEIIWI